MGGLPGVRVGPLDPDRTADFGEVAGKSSARALIRLHAQAHPPNLVAKLGLPLDSPRTKGLDIAEVRSYLAGLTLENGDPVVPDKAVVVGAAVRGSRDQEQFLTFAYRTESGRTAKWYADYSEEGLPNSYEDGSLLVKVEEMNAAGLVGDPRANAGESETAEAKENRRLKNEIKRLTTDLDRVSQEVNSAQVPGADGGAEPEGEPDEGPDAEAEEDGAAGATPASQEPPYDGYDDVKAAEVVKELKAEGTSDEERQAILDYEKAHANRKSVVGAAEQSLGARGDAD